MKAVTNFLFLVLMPIPTLLIMALWREKYYKDKGKENVIPKPPEPVSAEPTPPPEPPGPTIEEKIEELLKQNKR